MIRNTVIALSAAAAMGIALAPAAQAKTNFNIDVGFGFGGYSHHQKHGWGHGGYYDDWYGDGCYYVTVKHKKWNKWHTKKKVYFTKELVCY